MSAEHCECGAPGAFCYGIGGGWAVACQSCRDAAVAVTDDPDAMTAADFFALGPDGYMTDAESARLDASGRDALGDK